MATPDLLSYRPGRQPSLLVWILLLSIGSLLLLGGTLASNLSHNIQERNHHAIQSTRIIERSITRTLESVETNLRSLAKDIREGYGSRDQTRWLQARINNTLKFSPHIRQILLLRGETILADSTRKNNGQLLNLTALALTGEGLQFNNGLNIGRTLKQRFLPIKGKAKPSASRRSLIPVAYTVAPASVNRPPLTLVVALNAAYLDMLLAEGRMENEQHAGLFLNDGTLLLDRQLTSSWGPKIRRLVKSGQDESHMYADNHIGIFKDFSILRLSSRYPVGVVQESTRRDALNNWVAHNSVLLFLLILSAALMVLGSVWLILDSRRRQTLEAEVNLLFEAIDQSPVTVLITDSQRIIRYINPAFTRLMGFQDDQLIGQNAGILKSGKTPEQTYQSLRQHLADGLPWSGEFINQTQDDALITVSCTVSSVRNPQGEITHHIGVMSDVTASKDAENELRIAAVSFKAQTGMIVTDKQGVILRVNPGFTLMTGYEAEEVIGQTPGILKSGQHGPAFYQAMYDALNDQGYWKGEIWNRRKNGEIYPEWLVVSAVHDDQARITHYVASFNDISERKAAEEKITQLAFYDPLTKLPNRRLFNERLPRVMQSSIRSGQLGALIMLDLDHFKTINDTKGHDIGDALLVDVARRLTTTLREGDTVARMGGDEFLVMLENLGTFREDAIRQVERIAWKLLQKLAKAYQVQHHKFHISASMGIELFEGDDRQSEDILKHADIALYEAKSSGRNTFRFFNAAMLQEISAAMNMTQSLHEALNSRALALYLQPQTDEAGHIVAAEALIRWPTAEGDFISPQEFIPLAERTDLIIHLGEWVLNTACQYINQLQTTGIDPHFQLAVNISVKQFTQHDFIDKLKGTLLRHNVQPCHLKLELTEHLMLSDMNAAVESMHRLKTIGIGIDLDDFGTGFSSLNYLKSLPIDSLKIDASFVQDIEVSQENAAIVHTIILMAKTLGLSVIAEGVENHAQLNYLKAHECNLYQGFLMGEPAPLNHFMQRLEAQKEKATQ
ncbi:MAG: putative bifunctional diguanylate cyclase/phosphodiesterase [Pontibacterium sp.]